MKQESRNRNFEGNKKFSMSTLVIGATTSIVLFTLSAVVIAFVAMYQNTVTENAIITSEQAVNQVANTMSSYTDDMSTLMNMIKENITDEDTWEEFVSSTLMIRTDIVAISNYDETGALIGCWSEYVLKDTVLENLSYEEQINITEGEMSISKPHVESFFENEYPWVVTISTLLELEEDASMQICMDIRFSEIASYLDNVGIGQHGYCFIVDMDGNIIYHPQQRLIYSGIKEEPTQELLLMDDGSYTVENTIYTLQTLENCEWRVVGVSYVDEMITDKVENMVIITITILIMALCTILWIGILFANVFSRPAKKLKEAMEEFEMNAENFQYETVAGTKEILELSDSFGHMVLRIQLLMEKVRNEEVTLRKTELNALQAQINPHFLYNTLDSIAWMCEEERTQEAVDMVNALAKLFRISISKGHELITIDKEVQHARSYLQIQKFRYKNQFTYRIDVDDECEKYLCNKITLQPIIENAIYHGLDRMVEEGEIHICVTQTENDIVMKVVDNGVGMTQEQCYEILNTEMNDRVGIGIKNVHDRAQIYFGEEYGLRITSELDIGTEVEIRMPKIMEGEYEEK